MIVRPLGLAFGTALALLWSVSAPVLAAEGHVRVELNKLEAHGDSCRAYLVLENGTGAAFIALKLDLVMFDPDGIVARRLAVDVAPLPAGKTSLKVFDIAATPCARVGRVLLNDVLSCEGAGGSALDCLPLIETTSRGDVAFIK